MPEYVLFNMLCHMLCSVMRTQNQHAVVQKLIDCAFATLRDSKYILVGGNLLWLKHTGALEKMQNTLNTLELEEVRMWIPL